MSPSGDVSGSQVLFTGGKIGNFHQEVIDVFEEHVATIYDKIDYVSILADGLGSIALSSI